MSHIALRRVEQFGVRSGLPPLGSLSATTVIVSSSGYTIPIKYLAAEMTAQRSEELGADRLAIDVIAASGQDPSGLATYLSRCTAPTTGFVFSPLPNLLRRLSAVESAVSRKRHPSSPEQMNSEFNHIQREITRLLESLSTGAPSLLRR